MKKSLIITVFGAVALVASAPAQLLIDFNSTNQDNGPHNQAGYQAYDAGHEVAADFTAMNYAAFGGTVSLTPDWPDTTDNRVQQMIDRTAAWDDLWTGSDLDLLTDWIGIDTRTGNGGNGNYDGTIGSPTAMTLALGGLPASEYGWTSFHHDTEKVWAPFAVDISTDGGGNYAAVGAFEMTNSGPGGVPPNPVLTTSGDILSLTSTVSFSFTANGTDDVLVRFTPLSQAGVHQQIFGVNGFQLNRIPEPSVVALIAGVLGVLALGRRRRSC